MDKFQIGQIVEGKVGTFKIIGFITIGDEPHAKVKCYSTLTKTVARGQLALPLSILRAV